MKLMINHQTHYQYTDYAQNSIQYIKMIPQSNEHQSVLSWDISVPGKKSLGRDAFDNIWLTTSQRFKYLQMVIMAQGVVEIHPDVNMSRDNGQINPCLFLQPTVSTLHNQEMFDFAKNHVPVVNHRNLVTLAQALLEHMPYSSFSTNVTTSAIDAFQAQQGVCQDHSHVFIAMCKALAIPARYVSGYLYVEDKTHLASHAWTEVFINDSWYCFDISNQLFSPSAHIYVATGRDYWDVAPVRGVRQKGGIESMQSIVQVLAC
ncbi:transglutaminase family protein [Acinetobacter stercoris]|uniref:Transglutaminase-like superfamily protein n=1 Tax=Acinetobacter stercoris TaxID=2126983 RepID=A0A2U3MXF8_9GAMM|nr:MULTISPECIES: transglutaminase family protein [Acinetobacter]SPL70122.1 Transglutaminase-like superfamily protein [Acinetobacter stercoris]